MIENDYTLAWGLYAVAALGCLLVGFKFTGWMWRWLREPLRVVLAVLLLTPTVVDPVKDSFAPAIAITVLDVAFKVGNNAWRAVSDFAMYGMIAFVLYFLFVLVRWPLEKRARERRLRAQAAAQREAAEAQALAPGEALAAERSDRYRDDPPALPAGAGRVEPRL
ncbi:MFS transporter [Pseudomonas sp. I3-I5]|uniref:MFS transporter n=1 Tax=Pseudomonas sp. I3-I5 TaxID=2926671 RepID=UPI001F60278F|nr:MFS transporter [Pseudomonas sp. I3-I5]UNT12388.1 MFS transporter [Pseudomonas sp. I3-I5]